VGGLSGKANVEMDDLLDEEQGGAKLREWVSLVQLRPQPPDADSEAAAGFEASLVPGGRVEFDYLDGWWEVEVIGVAERGKGRDRHAVYSLRYSRTVTAEHHGVRANPNSNPSPNPNPNPNQVIAEHHGIRASELRPAWLWRGGGEWVQGADAIQQALGACGGLPPLGEVVSFQPGSPTAPAALFANGTRRLEL